MYTFGRVQFNQSQPIAIRSSLSLVWILFILSTAVFCLLFVNNCILFSSMRPFVVIRQYESADLIARKELIKQYAMSFAFDAFISCLFREVNIYYPFIRFVE